MNYTQIATKQIAGYTTHKTDQKSGAQPGTRSIHMTSLLHTHTLHTFDVTVTFFHRTSVFPSGTKRDIYQNTYFSWRSSRMECIIKCYKVYLLSFCKKANVGTYLCVFMYVYDKVQNKGSVKKIL